MLHSACTFAPGPQMQSTDEISAMFSSPESTLSELGYPHRGALNWTERHRQRLKPRTAARQKLLYPTVRYRGTPSVASPQRNAILCSGPHAAGGGEGRAGIATAAEPSRHRRAGVGEGRARSAAAASRAATTAPKLEKGAPDLPPPPSQAATAAPELEKGAGGRREKGARGGGEGRRWWRRRAPAEPPDPAVVLGRRAARRRRRSGRGAERVR
jgi:hypothetical protein